MTKRRQSEFADFVRDTAVGAVDRLTERISELDPPLRAVLRSWKKLSSAQKEDLLDEVIAAGQVLQPAPKSRKKAKK